MPLPLPVMELGSTEAVKRAVEAGLGVSIVLEMSSFSEIQEGRLLALRLEPEIHETFWLARSAELEPDHPLFSYLLTSAKLHT